MFGRQAEGLSSIIWTHQRPARVRPPGRSPWLARLTLLAASLFIPALTRAQTPLIPLEPNAFTITSGHADLTGNVLHLSGPDPTTITFAPKDKPWDLSQYEHLTLRLRNPSTHAITLSARAENPDAEKLMNASRTAIELLAGEEKSLTLRLTRRPEDPTYAPFKPFYMYYKAMNVRDNTLDPAKVSKLVLTVDHWEKDGALDLLSITPEGTGLPASVPFLPFVDKYGQYTHSDWPGKIDSDADFAARIAEEKRARADWDHPKEWDIYGGWNDGPTLTPTGHFHPAKHDGKWWLVDPLGHLFWSFGTTGVAYGGDVTPYTERESWFADLDLANPLTAPFLHEGRNATYQYYQRRPWKGLDIQRLNLLRKYGPDYETKVAEVSHDRLHSWGFNTMGNWSAPKIYLLHRTPYVVPVSAWTPTIHYRFQDFYDPAWEPALRAAMEKQRDATADDPWCIGYFVDNERWYGPRPRAASIGEETLKNPPERHAKTKDG